MVSETFKVYSSECLLGVCVGDPTSTRDENISLYISGCKLLHPMRYMGLCLVKSVECS